MSERDRAGGVAAEPVAAAPGMPHDPWRDAPEPATAETARGHWAWVRVEQEQVYSVDWHVWQTAWDERLCPECAPLEGQIWEEGDGPTPPLHVNCRCWRAYWATEWRTRPVTVWERRWFPA